MPAPPYKYDVFISFSSADREWARLLEQELVKRGFEVFLDEKRIDAGQPWRQQLLADLQASQHLVVLWSNKTTESGWVGAEQARFDIMLSDSPTSNRRFISIILEGDNPAYNHYQKIYDLKDKGTYAAGIAQLDEHQAVWQAVLTKIEQSLKSDDSTLPVPLAILTLTQERLNELNPSWKPTFADNLNIFLKQTGLKKTKLSDHYGQQRTEWRPFGGNTTIMDILNDLKYHINLHLKQSSDVQFRWEPVSEAFWSNDIDAVQREVDKLTTGLAVIVIDPLAFYDSDVRDRFDLLDKCFQNDQALIMLLTPFAMPSPSNYLRTFVKNMAKRIFDHVYEPPFGPKVPYARCGVNIGDDVEIKRLLLATLRSHLGVSQAQPSPEIFRMS